MIFEWWRNTRTNPRILVSEPPGFEIIKMEAHWYQLWKDDQPPGKPLAENCDWMVLAEIANKMTGS